jgi:hypothetical protein
MEGIVRFLVLERLKDDNIRTTFLEGKRGVRSVDGRMPTDTAGVINVNAGDLKVKSGIGIQMNDYDFYRPGWGGDEL